uniref:C3H1-type domain-containing protein n=1 Tax=Romanomermis culicivorax TaxID=13658 RepID=A0A915HKB6_ROMCU
MSLLDLVANIDNIVFDVERSLLEQRGAQPLPFSGMDKTGAAICAYFLRHMCDKGTQCPFRHVSGEKSVVCKHWLRGLCKKGDQCEFLHEYDLSKMPECYFFSKYISGLAFSLGLDLDLGFGNACGLQGEGRKFLVLVERLRVDVSQSA